MLNMPTQNQAILFYLIHHNVTGIDVNHRIISRLNFSIIWFSK